MLNLECSRQNVMWVCGGGTIIIQAYFSVLQPSFGAIIMWTRIILLSATLMMTNIFIFTLTEDQEQPLVQYLMEKDRRGTYVVKEEVEKAPVHQHPCNLSRTAVKMTFPEMKQEVFMNLLGYRGSNMIYLNRCKGVRFEYNNDLISCDEWDRPHVVYLCINFISRPVMTLPSFSDIRMILRISIF